MTLGTTAISTYLPGWRDAAGSSVNGPDEDALTLAVAAAAPLIGDGGAVMALHVITSAPQAARTPMSLLPLALGLDESIPFVTDVGEAPATLEQLARAAAGTLVVTVDEAPARAAAALVQEAPPVTVTARAREHFPAVVAEGSTAAGATDYRLDRAVRMRPLLAALGVEGNSQNVLAAGLPAREARRCGVTVPFAGTGPSVALFALGAAADEASHWVVAVGGNDGVRVRVDGAVTVLREARPTMPAPAAPDEGPDIPISVAAYHRALVPKVTFAAARCSCGAWNYPPRERCPSCRAHDDGTLHALPRRGAVYSAAAVHVPVPGLARTYSLAVVQLDDVALRVLAPVTDAPAGWEPPIGERGKMVFRRHAVRTGIADYGFAFQPEATP